MKIIRTNNSYQGKHREVGYLRSQFCRFLMIFISIVLSGSAFSQEKTLTGKITDEATGEPLTGASVAVKGTTQGTVADVNGNYSVNVQGSETILVFSFLGYETKELVASGTTLNVQLTMQVEGLEEIVVVGYGTTKARDLTGAVASVKAEELEDKPFASIDQALQGKVSGVTISQNSGAPGGGVSVRVRGITSLTGSNEPLYVVDGVPLDGSSNNESFSFNIFGGENGQNRVSALSTINPSDIVSIEVLKDASATAIYGSRASNGVILITTKNGEKGKSRISYDGYYGYQELSKYLEVMDLQAYAMYQNEIHVSTGQEPNPSFSRPELLGPGTDWQKEIFRVAPIQSHQVSISGGSKKTSVYTSINYFDQEGILINTDYKRIGLRLNLDHEVNKWIKVGNNLTISNGKEKIAYNDSEDGVIMGALRQAPNVPVKYSDGSWGGPTKSLGSGEGYNPVAWSEIRSSHLERNKVLGNLFADIIFLSDLKFRSELGYDFNFNKMSSFYPSYEIGDRVKETGESYKANTHSFYWILKNYLTYSKNINAHSFTGMIGHEAQHSTWERVIASRGGFIMNELTALSIGDADLASANSLQNQWAMQSAFARANYSYNNKYLLTATYRADASSNFGKNNKWGFFPSFSTGWIVSEEPFMEAVSGVLNWMKIRAGYGEVGNQNIPAYSYGQILNSINTVYGSAFIPGNIANPDIKWESTTSTNVGIELGFIDRRIRLDADFYIKSSKDFLYQQPLPAFYGAGADGNEFRAPWVNLGEMTNRGVDIRLNTINFKNKQGFDWNTSIVFSMYKNELTSLADDNSTINKIIQFNQTVTQTSVGNPVGQFYGFVTEGLFTKLEDIQDAPDQGPIDKDNGVWLGDYKFKDINEDGKITDEDRTIIGDPHPDFTFSLSNQVSYKNFDLNISLYGSYGNEILNWTRKVTEGMTDSYANQSVNVANRYRETNTDTDIPRYVSGDPNNNARVSDRFIEDGSFLRIQNVTFGYNIPNKLLKKTGVISSCRAYITVQNLHTFTNYTGYDPDIGSHSNNALLSGVDNGRYPVPRTYMLGFKVDF